MTYVVCGSVAETDEVDLLDAPAFAAFARGDPPVLSDHIYLP